jgi:hypothetical protein
MPSPPGTTSSVCDGRRRRYHSSQFTYAPGASLTRYARLPSPALCAPRAPRCFLRITLPETACSLRMPPASCAAVPPSARCSAPPRAPGPQHRSVLLPTRRRRDLHLRVHRRLLLRVAPSCIVSRPALGAPRRRLSTLWWRATRALSTQPSHRKR